MRKNTHIRLANQIVSKTGISIYSEEAKYLRGGSIAPDQWKNYPHHYGKEGSIRNQIIKSRKCWLRGEKEDCCFRLGVAFHYLADKWTLMRGSDKRHASWERSIDDSTFVDETNWVVQRSGLSNLEKEQYYSLLEKLEDEPLGKDETLQLACLNRPSHWSDPSIDLNMAYRVCLRTAQSVFSSTTPPIEVQEKMENTGKIMDKMLANRRFQLVWLLTAFMMFGGITPLFAKNFAISFLLLMALLFFEIYQARMFFLKKLSAFKKIQTVRSIIHAWLFMVVPFFVIIGYGILVFASGDLILKVSVLIVGSGIFSQIVLQFGYLYGKMKVHELFTYIDWFNEPQAKAEITPNSQANVSSPDYLIKPNLSSTDLITQKQRRYIEVLSSFQFAGKGNNEFIAEYLETHNKQDLSQLSKKEASDLIQILLKRKSNAFDNGQNTA